jgi:glycosyltransferase involved in cell wall biosynthesis
MTMRTLRILAPTRYPWSFNSPRASVHHIERRDFLPLNRFSRSLEGVTVFNPLPPRRFDLVHAFNRIPLGRTPFVIGFESHLPRAFGLERTRYFEATRALLASDRCRRIVAISDYARRIFVSQHAGSSHADRLFAKLETRLPNTVVHGGARASVAITPGQPIRIVFVGAHFGRKGGCVAVRMAEKANRVGFPLQVEIVSSLQVGGAIWTDPADTAFFQQYLALLDLPNVRLHRALPNNEVITLLRTAHFSLLTTFCDTFGYSAFESLAQETPVIATRQGALPEFLHDGENAIMLDLETQENGDWVHSDSPRRLTPEFAVIFAAEVERMADEALSRVVALTSEPERYAAMRHEAGLSAVHHFGADAASAYWDRVYSEAVAP